MPGYGNLGRVGFVDLSKGEVSVKSLPDEVYRNFIGGYGLGAYVLFKGQSAEADPLGPGNMLGFIAGPLTGTDAVCGNRFTVVGKSPKTGMWGDANCGGKFGPMMKFAGFDAVFFRGIAPRPVCFVMSDGKAELKPADKLWGKDTNETEGALAGEYGKDASVVSIGPVGERCSLLACIINEKGRAAGRSGLGAVMGSKKLKAVVAVPTGEVPVADAQKLKELRKEGTKAVKEHVVLQIYSTYGTAGITANSVATGDCPVKNWAGTPEDFPNASKISDESVKAIQYKKYACWRCPIACGGFVRVKSGPYAVDGHKPEYETLAGFGALCLNDNLESIAKINEICNKSGLDTISTAATVAFAIECFEKGVLDKSKTGGLELRWGNDEAIVALTEQIAKGEGIGAKLADGSAAGAGRVGRKAGEYAIHAHGEELPYHDPRCVPGIASNFKIDATPGRHTQFSSWVVEAGLIPGGMEVPTIEDKYEPKGKALAHKIMSNWMHVVSAAGQCMFGAFGMPANFVHESINAATGYDLTMEEVVGDLGSRIAAMRTGFNVREGIMPMSVKLPARVLGIPPLAAGPLKGKKVDVDTQVKEYLELMGWDVKTGAPTKEALEELGLDFVAEELYP